MRDKQVEFLAGGITSLGVSGLIVSALTISKLALLPTILVGFAVFVWSFVIFIKLETIIIKFDKINKAE